MAEPGRAVAISVVVPVYNEEDSIEPFLARTVPVLEKIGPYEIIFCLDPCTDRTEEAIRAAARANPRIGLLVFSRRVGQPAATLAGIFNCRGDACAVIDVDLQDPPEVIADLHGRLAEGFEVVYGRRRSRRGETLPKRLVSWAGYKVINRIASVDIPRNTGDFRIMSRRAVEELRWLSESHGFLRGMVALVGFRQGEVLYDRDQRHAGQRKYNAYLGSLKIGFNGIVGFSTYPLSLILVLGFVVAGLGLLGSLYILVSKLAFQQDYPLGVPTLIILVLLLGGIQLISVGVLGEYIGRTYDEVRRRPLYVVDRAVNVPVIDARGPRSGPAIDIAVAGPEPTVGSASGTD